MQKNPESCRIHRPKTIHDLLVFAGDYPDALLYAGGTRIMLEAEETGTIAREHIIYLGDIEELRKIKRAERFLEIGAAVSLSRLLSIGPHVIPEALYHALVCTGNPSIRNIATLGGNICIASPYSNILTVLMAMDTLIELRTQVKSMWLPISHFLSKKGKDLIDKGYILTRIRIPFGNWNYQVFRKIGRKKSQQFPSLTFCGLARLNKGILSDVRFTFGALGSPIFSNRGFEAGFMGRKLPLQDRVRDLLSSELTLILKPQTDRYSTDLYRRATAIRLVKWFLSELNQALY
ncbi:MAG: FAD binding domain-containing protein [Spirochaetales bacterium]|nr:FAD binding domain-containing protein [Spirochaetales bacterium]